MGSKENTSKNYFARPILWKLLKRLMIKNNLQTSDRRAVISG
jgi:hypothetical protein